MSRTYALALGILAFVLVAGTMTACEQSRHPLTSGPAATTAAQAPSTAPVPTTEAKAAASLRARADELRDRGRTDEALEAYQAAIRQDPAHLGVRVAFARLLAEANRREEAVQAYTWVFQNAMPGSDVAREAEQWLRDAGSYTVVNETPSSADPNMQGRLSGHLAWTSLDPTRPVPFVSLILEGNDAVTKGQVYSTRAQMNGDYEFTSVRPGGYRLIGKSQMIRLWETDVVVTHGGITVFNLDQSQTIAPQDALLPKS
jgi:tetratricopeptide (TPR) repeat protein